jgi:hypothetical protein
MPQGDSRLAAWTNLAIGRVRRHAWSLALLLAVAVSIASCDGPPDRPSHLDYFRVAGPGEVAPGTSAPFKALLDQSARLSDVSQDAQWISSNPSVLSIDGGLAAGHVAGEATVTARFEEHQTDAKPVIVLPAGTYRLRGTVVLETTTVPLPAVRVEVPAVGLSTTTDSQGRFALYGVPPDAEVHVAKEGFTPSVVSVHLQGHDQQMTPGLRPMLPGTYTLTISPGSCSNGPPLPADLLQRTYTVVFVQSGTQVQATVAGANVTVVLFSGSYSAQGRWNLSVAFRERLPDGNTLSFNGAAFVRPADLAGEFNGRIALSNPSAADAIARCEASAFRFALTR